jgi:hypothetical protein
MVGSNDTNFCPLSYFSFNTNLGPHIYTGESNRNLRFLELKDQIHGGVNQIVGNEMNDIDSNLTDFFSLKNSAFDCHKDNSTPKKKDTFE